MLECPQNKPDRPISKSKVGGNVTVLACNEALLFKGGLKLTTKQYGDVRYFEDKGGINIPSEGNCSFGFRTK